MPAAYDQTVTRDGNNEEAQQDEEARLVCNNGEEHLHTQMQVLVTEQSVEFNPKKNKKIKKLLLEQWQSIYKCYREKQKPG